MSGISRHSVDQLKGVPETLLITLAARAGTERFEDPVAREWVRQLDFDPAIYFGNASTARGVIERSLILDRIAREFFERFPSATAVSLGCGLSTQFQRVDNGKMKWIDVDFPEVIQLKKKLVSPSPRYQTIAASLTDDTWLAHVPKNEPVLFLCEGVSMYLYEEQLKSLLARCARHVLPGSVFVFDYFCWLFVNQAHRSPAIRKTGASFHWGLRRVSDMRFYHPKLVLEENFRVRIFSAPISWLGRLFRLVFGVDFYGIAKMRIQ